MISNYLRSGTILEQFGHRFIDSGHVTLAAKLKICIHMCGEKIKILHKL